MTPSQLQRAAAILAQLLALDSAWLAPDAQDLREVSRVVLEEQLRQIQAEPIDLESVRNQLRRIVRDETPLS